jgi:hypothetical protein
VSASQEYGRHAQRNGYIERCYWSLSAAVASALVADVREVLSVPSYVFPHYRQPRPRDRQPDYKQWRKVAFGMSRQEVVALLGRPLRDRYMASGDDYWSFGYLELPMTPHVRTYYFLIGFDDNGRVWYKEDPFGGVFSSDGLPSKPLIFTPAQDARFTHHPRLVDMRWQPVSGVYPMHYEVEVGFAAKHPDGKWDYSATVFEENLPFPYYVHDHGGDNPGRFRIRGVNKLGKGPWSDYRRFQFDTSALNAFW